MPLSEDIPGLDFLGMTYDVFGKYADARSTKKKVVSFGNRKTWEARIFENKPYNFPVNPSVQAEPWNEFHGYGITGKSIHEYHVNLNIKTHLSYEEDTKIEYFKGEMDSSVEIDARYNAESEFARYVDLQIMWELQIEDISYKKLKSYLLPHFVEELENTEPMAFFKTYGTHLLRSLLVGGTVRRTTALNQYEVNLKLGLSYVAEESYRDLIQKQSGKIDAELQAEIKIFNEQKSSQVEVLGGKAGSGTSILHENNYNDWIKTLQDYPTFVEFVPNGNYATESLLPLWNLCSGAREKELKDAFLKYAQLHSMNVRTGASFGDPILIEMPRTNKFLAVQGGKVVAVDRPTEPGTKWTLVDAGAPDLHNLMQTMTNVNVKSLATDEYLLRSEVWKAPALSKIVTDECVFVIENSGRGAKRGRMEEISVGSGDGYLCKSANLYVGSELKTGPIYIPGVWSFTKMKFHYP